jgi:hypothetical protein
MFQSVYAARAAAASMGGRPIPPPPLPPPPPLFPLPPPAPLPRAPALQPPPPPLLDPHKLLTHSPLPSPPNPPIPPPQQVVEYRLQYDGSGSDPNTSQCALGPGAVGGARALCRVRFSVDKAMKAPVYVYYELQNFYQNHRRYVKSRSDTQLAGTVFDDESKVSDCDPLRSRDGKVLHPCGLVANSYFNDTFSLVNPPGFALNEAGISWESDRKQKFKAVSQADMIKYAGKVTFINETYPGVGNVDNEHFIVWMRPAALPNFRKLYGRIEKDVPAGSVVEFDVVANYPVTGFDGKKAIVLSTLSFLGGKNPFLGVAYVVVGFLCVAMAAVFAIKQKYGARKLGDTAFLVYNTQRR